MGCGPACLAGRRGRRGRRVVRRRGEHGAVVADGGGQPILGGQRLLDAGGVPRAVVAGRPVGPEPVDEGQLVLPHGELGQRGLEHEHVPAAAELVVVEEPEPHRRRRWHGHGDHPPPAVGLGGRGRVGEERPPVVADDDGAVVAPEGLVERARVEGQGAGVVAPVGRHAGRRVAPEERGDGVVAGGGQLREQVAPRVGGVGEPVQAQGQWAVGRAVLEVGELHAVGRDGAGGVAGGVSFAHGGRVADGPPAAPASLL